MNRINARCFPSLVLLVAVAFPCAALSQPAAGKKIKLNFDGATLVEVVKAVSAFSGKNFLVEQGLRERKLTVISATPVTAEEAYRAFCSALDIEGIEAVEDGAFVRIVHRRSAAESPRSERAGRCGDVPAGAIRQVDENTWSIMGAETESLWKGRTDCLAYQARIVPFQKEGKVVGIKLYGIRPRSLCAELGLKNGDVVLTVNGMSLTSPENALAIYQALRDAKKLVVELLRRDQPLRHSYLIE